MPRTPLELGMTWAALTVVNVRDEVEPYGGGRVETTYRLRCLCGEEIDWTKADWLRKGGTRKVRDCGCGARINEFKVGTFANIPWSVKVALENYVSAHIGLDMSQAMTKMLRFALEHQELIE